MNNMLHLKSVSEELLGIIGAVSKEPAFKEFRLCGGTALALHIGHRKSNDADFVLDREFNTDETAALLTKLFQKVTDLHTGAHGLFARVNGIKTDFLTWNLPFIRPPVISDGITLTHVEEIIAMKLFAITQRGEKKDYMDIAIMLREYSVKDMLGFYKERHKGSDEMNVLRSLSSFSDIENQPEPVMLNSFTWNETKSKLRKAVKDFF